MKKIVILGLLAGMIVAPVPGNSQAEALLVDAALSLLGLKSGDKYGKARLIELKKILDENKKELAKLARIEESSQAKMYRPAAKRPNPCNHMPFCDRILLLSCSPT